MANRTLARLPAETIWLTAGFLLLCGVYYVWGWSRTLGDFGGDNAYYLLIARHFSPWSAHSDVAAYFYANSLYPPLFPLVLALFGGGESLLAAHAITITLLLFAFIALYLWLRSLGRGRTESSLVTLLFALLPGTYMQALSLLSENLYLLASLGCLASASMFDNTRRQRWLWVAAICAAAAMLTRGAGVSLLAAFVLYLVIHRPRGSWRLVLAAVLPIVLWKFLGQQQAPGYLSSLADKYGPDLPAALMRQFTLGVWMLWHGWTTNFTGGSAGIWLTAVVGLLGLLGAAWRVYLRKLDGMYSGLYIGLVFIWPFPAEARRLLFVIVPVLLVQCLLLLGKLKPLVLARQRVLSGHLLVLLVAVIAAPDLLLTARRFVQPLPDQTSHFRRSQDWYVPDVVEARNNVLFDEALTGHLKTLPGLVPEDGCVYAIKPSLVGYYAGRISMAPPRLNWNEAEFNAYLDKTNCRYFYLMAFASPTFPELYYPLSRMNSSLRMVSAVRVAGSSGDPVGMLAERARR